MLIGVPKEIKNHEYRIGLTPAAVREYVENGHDVIIENNGGAAIGFTNEQYMEAGATIIDTPEENEIIRLETIKFKGEKLK